MQGNELFRDQDFQGALNRNKIALDYVDDELLFQLQGRYLDDAHAVKAPLHLNMAACHLKMEDWTAATEEASECLKWVGPGTEALEPKALYRRAKAHIALGRTEEAMKDLQKARELCAPSASHPPDLSGLALCPVVCVLQTWLSRSSCVFKILRCVCVHIKAVWRCQG